MSDELREAQRELLKVQDEIVAYTEVVERYTFDIRYFEQSGLRAGQEQRWAQEDGEGYAELARVLGVQAAEHFRFCEKYARRRMYFRERLVELEQQRDKLRLKVKELEDADNRNTR